MTMTHGIGIKVTMHGTMTLLMTSGPLPADLGGLALPAEIGGLDFQVSPCGYSDTDILRCQHLDKWMSASAYSKRLQWEYSPT